MPAPGAEAKRRVECHKVLAGRRFAEIRRFLEFSASKLCVAGKQRPLIHAIAKRHR